MTINEDIAATLQALAKHERDDYVMNTDLANETGLDPGPLSDAVGLLEDSGFAKVLVTIGTAPYGFSRATITPAGRFELERATRQAQDASGTSEPSIRPTPLPVGSPYGFTDEDWEFIERARRSPKLLVTIGHQFESDYFTSDRLLRVLREEFESALSQAVREIGVDLELDLVPLRGGYGGHLFNQIARSIIASDIAIFETSDLNPNVMIEMGVALTWGKRVHPIREVKAPEPPF